MIKLSTLLFALASVVLVEGIASAADEHNVAAGLTASGGPLGLHGHDPVALLEGRVVAGSAKYAAKHDDVVYYFTSAGNKARFTKAPAKFTPQFGGFCTYGASVGKKFDGDPRYFRVIRGRVYVFLNEEIRAAFDKDPAGALANAKKNWKTIRTRDAATL